MNTIKIISAGLIAVAFISCNNRNNETAAEDSLAIENSTDMRVTSTAQVIPGTYTDLNTGREVHIVRDPQTGWAMDSISRVPVEFYIDRSGDTLYRTGMVVNYAIVRDNNKWKFDEAKIKRDGDDIKIKFSDGGKIKAEKDEMKIIGKEGKIKIDDDTIKVKPN